MKRAYLLAVLVVTMAPIPCWAQFGAVPAKVREKWKVEVKMDDNRTFEGILTLASFDVQSDLGLYAIKPEKIKEVHFEVYPTNIEERQGRSPNDFVGTIVTTTGEKFSGLILFPQEGIETELGTLRPNTLKLRSLTFKGKPPA